MNHPFPRMIRVRQQFEPTPKIDIAGTIQSELQRFRSRIKPGARIGLTVGSRGISHLDEIIEAIASVLKQIGAKPFILPAMGSHGGATAEGQREIVETFGITEEKLGIPIHASMEVRQVGISNNGIPVFCSIEALKADGIVLVNRIKPHTDFSGTLGSGLLKMAVVGLGKHSGATRMHAAASRIGHEQAIRGIAAELFRAAPILGGVAIVENAFHKTARLVGLLPEEIEKAETRLLEQARALMPKIPFDEVDLLIVERIGKNISGAGMDPNITGRWVQGYSSSLAREGRPAPFIRRIFVRGLSPETHGNAIGIGAADATLTKVVDEMDRKVTYINSLTSLTLTLSKVPVYFETDRECIDWLLQSLAIEDTTSARVVRILDTLNLGEMEISEALQEEATNQPLVEKLSQPVEMKFDHSGFLPPF